LIKAWSYFDPHEYAARVLANAPLHMGRLTIENTALLPAVHLLRNLRDLRVNLPEGADLDCLEGLPALTELHAQTLTAASLPALAEHTNLREVTAIRLEGPVNDVSPFLALPKLRVLCAYSGQSVSDLNFITRLPRLRRLSLPGLAEVEDFTPLTSQFALQEVRLYRCKNLKNLDALRPLTALRHLTLDGASLPADSVTEIVKTWPNLGALEVADADWVSTLDPVTALPLWGLTASSCPNLTDITPITRLRGMKWLFLVETPFSGLGPITGLSKLSLLSLGGRDRLIDLTPVSSLLRLRQLYLLNVSEDTDLTPIGDMRDLTITMYEGQQVWSIGRLHPSTRVEWRPND
jgi:hypothetical protein